MKIQRTPRKRPSENDNYRGGNERRKVHITIMEKFGAKESESGHDGNGKTIAAIYGTSKNKGGQANSET